ncbi:MAG TPA: SusD/RagB family nutrient-binding outer membrane lipoprotein, partial [Ferruginibacter sp.]|nr:SusD/RagB family nutrient-binding outer membrane lipoprotein [Ferruginibacter sp.]
SVSVGASNLTLQLIFKEKYKALFLSPETWNDARRTNYNYTGFSLPANVALPTFIRRLNYPSVELTRNGPNVPSITGLDQKLWWDQ